MPRRPLSVRFFGAKMQGAAAANQGQSEQIWFYSCFIGAGAERRGKEMWTYSFITGKLSFLLRTVEINRKLNFPTEFVGSSFLVCFKELRLCSAQVSGDQNYLIMTKELKLLNEFRWWRLGRPGRIIQLRSTL